MTNRNVINMTPDILIIDFGFAINDKYIKIKINLIVLYFSFKRNIIIKNI